MRIIKGTLALAVTTALSASAIQATADAGAAKKPRKAAGAIGSQAHFKYPVHSRAIGGSLLYDQSGTQANGFPSQNFETAYDAYDAAGADDFVVTDAAGWNVGAFNFQIAAGTSPPADPSTATYDIEVYPDAGGLPAANPVCSYPGAAGVVDANITSLSVSLPTPCALAQGAYWVSMVVNLDLAVGGQIFWDLGSQTGLGADAVWQNPGDGFGTSCSTWSALASCVGTGTGGPVGGGLTTALFQVIGSVGSGGGCGAGELCLVSTVGTDTSAGACGTADTIDATVGDQLNFCYTITNNTGVELDYHTLQNNVDGTLFSLLNQPVPDGGTFQYNHIETVSTTNTYNSTWTGQDVPPDYLAEVESGGSGCPDRIFADGFDGSAPGCGASNFVDITGTGTPLGNSDDQAIAVTMPFSFNFYGTTSNSICVDNNGFVAFYSGACSDFDLDFYQNVSLPAASMLAPAIMPLWDDFTSASGDVYTDTRGTTPNRQFIVEWSDRVHYPGSTNTDGATFEIILNEDGTIQFEYADVSYTGGGEASDCTGGVCATIGLQNDATLFNQFSAFSAAVTDNSGIKWTSTSPQVFTSADSVSVNVGAPQIVVNPSPITGTVMAGGGTTIPFAVENHGDRDLVWSLGEAGASNVHFPPPGTRFAMPMGDPSKSTTARAQVAAHGRDGKGSHVSGRAKPITLAPGVTAFAADINFDEFYTLDVTADHGTNVVGPAQTTAFGFKFLDGDFSKAYGIDKFGSMTNTFATVSTADGTITPIGTSIASADSNGWTGFAEDPTTGTLYGSGTTCGSSSHLYTIDRNTGTATLVGEMTGMGCAIWIAISPAGLMYGVDIVNDALYAIDKTTGAAALIGSVGFDANYAQDADFDQSTGILYWAAFDVDAGGDEIRTVDLNTGATTLVYSLGATQIAGLATETTGGPCAQPQDLPWLSLDPLTGTTSPSGSTSVNATIDGTGANPGDVLAGTVCAMSNDPVNHSLATPITVDVTGPIPVSPTIAKAFNPTTVSFGTTSTLTITLGNTNATPATLMADLIDAFPSGMIVAATPNASTDCGAAVTADPLADSVTLAAGAAVPGNGSCTITVDVDATAPGAYANDIPVDALQTDAGNNTAPADATLSVGFAPPVVGKVFNPSTVDAGVPSTLTITLGNSNPSPAALTASLTDAFPPGLVVANPANASTTCGGAVTAVSGTSAVTLDNAGSAIPPGVGCTIQVDVESTTAGTYANDIPVDALQTDAGNNTAPADATLVVNPAPPTVSKAFNPTSVSASNPSTLTITLGNANGADATLTSSLTDTFPPGLVVAGTANASTNCGGTVTAVPGTNSVTLDSAGSAIPGGGSCTVTVDVTAASANDYPNDIPVNALQTDVGSNTVPADATLTVTP